MRLFWVIVLVCFLWVSTHEAVAHAGPCACPTESAGEHHDGEPQSADSSDTDDDHHGCDSHGHFRGAVSTHAQSINKDLAMPATPVTFDSIGIHPQEHLLISLNRVFSPPARDVPHYLFAQTLLL